MATKRKQMMDELKALDDQQLRQREATLRRGLFDLRAEMVTSKVKDLTRLRKDRREIARIHTLLTQRESAVGAGDQPQR